MKMPPMHNRSIHSISFCHQELCTSHPIHTTPKCYYHSSRLTNQILNSLGTYCLLLPFELFIWTNFCARPNSSAAVAVTTDRARYWWTHQVARRNAADHRECRPVVSCRRCLSTGQSFDVFVFYGCHFKSNIIGFRLVTTFLETSKLVTAELDTVNFFFVVSVNDLTVNESGTISIFGFGRTLFNLRWGFSGVSFTIWQFWFKLYK